ncbi:hypothetical protein GPA27_17830 [Aromatoleum toluolicum]|uniref:ABC transporter ATP-binding protein n=1 Tax=Aromatoleum toluolicum TaxID=90060 RepID=A0ABX1NIU2_9RHOO|nr:hypothetical protein [Aromatoleum toluolicum]NMF99243.1 hypothetical protein [Aromatoleum toluolicum]
MMRSQIPKFRLPDSVIDEECGYVEHLGSLGLAPAVIKEIYVAMAEIACNGLTAIIVEQDVYTAQRVSQRLYCFQEGRVSLKGNSSDLTHEQISHAYFGV